MGIGMAYIKSDLAKVGTEFQVMIRDHPVKAVVEQPPLYKGGSHK